MQAVSTRACPEGLLQHRAELAQAGVHVLPELGEARLHLAEAAVHLGEAGVHLSQAGVYLACVTSR